MEIRKNGKNESIRIVMVDTPAGVIQTVVPIIPQLTVERLHEDAVIPAYAKDGDSGMDVYSPVDMLLTPQETAKIGAGFRVELPKHPFHELGYRWELQSRPRSGLNLKTEIVVKFGTIDNGYRGEFGVIIKNDTQISHELEHERDDDTQAVTRANLEVATSNIVFDLSGNMVDRDELVDLSLINWEHRFQKGTLLIRKGDRISQMVLNEVVRPLKIVEGVVNLDTDRGEGGFGSSGVQG